MVAVCAVLGLPVSRSRTQQEWVPARSRALFLPGEDSADRTPTCVGPWAWTHRVPE